MFIIGVGVCCRCRRSPLMVLAFVVAGRYCLCVVVDVVCCCSFFLSSWMIGV